jgi:hypothetical protein
MGQSPESPQRAFRVIALCCAAGNDAVAGFLLIRTERGLLLVHLWDNRPQVFGTVATAIANVERHDLVRFGVTTRPSHSGVCLVAQSGILDKLRQDRYQPAALKGPIDDG